MMCKACELLVGALQNVPAHEALKTMGKKKYKSMGFHTGRTETFRCSVCGTTWQLDMDKQDQHAGWEVIS